MTTNKPAVKRYYLSGFPGFDMQESEYGDYVEWEAYEDLQAERDALSAHVEEVNAYLSHLINYIPMGPGVIRRLNELQMQTPVESLTRLKAKWQAEAGRLDWLEQQARKSRTGISFDWVPTCEGEPSGFRFMRRHFIGEPAKTLRDAIDRVMRAEGGEV